MNRTTLIKIAAIMLSAIILTTSLVGCNEDTSQTSSHDSTTVHREDSASAEETDEYGMTQQQRNSFSMLYYLAITAEEIRTSKDNRLLLNDIYTSLLNDINPGAIDETTQDHLQNLRDIIKSYIDISVKRERLQYIYNQEKASAIKSAVPNPLNILSVTQSTDWKKLALNVAFTALDSYTNYKNTVENADQNFLMSGWTLDDEETAAIQKNRERAFDYMVDIVQEYELDGLLTLNEKSIETFVEICSIEVVEQRIHRLESEEKTYKLLGNYWLELADSYYENSQYQKCLDCIDKYNSLSTGIYRHDYNYAQILPKAINSAREIYTGEQYISVAKSFADKILENTTTDEWSIRYFAATAYLELYEKTNNKEFLTSAYNIIYDNITILLDEQCTLNSAYLEDIEESEITEPDYSFMTDDEKKTAEQNYKDELKRLKAYNEELKNKRKTELTPIYEPLVLNCNLLFPLTDEMNISDKDKAKIEAILQTKSNGVFLTKPINEKYSFTKTENKYSIDFSKNEILIPVYLLTENTKITASVSDDNRTTVFTDFAVKEVNRENTDFESFVACITSKQMDNYEWTADSHVTVKITLGDNFDDITFNYRVKEYQDNWLIPDKVVFEEV